VELMSWIRLHWDRALAGLLVVAGVVVLIVGYVGVADTGFPAEQIPYVISGGIGGFVLVAAAAALWISADLRDEWSKLTRVEDAIREQSVLLAQLLESPPEATVSDLPAGRRARAKS
jgi:hypothetical protein